MTREYKVITTLLNNTIIQYEENGVLYSIPMDESNADYQAYLRHLAGEDEGGTL